MWPLLVVFALFVTAQSDDCGCSESGTDRENLFSCVIETDPNVNFVPDWFDEEMRPIAMRLIASRRPMVRRYMARRFAQKFVQRVVAQRLLPARLQAQRIFLARVLAQRQIPQRQIPQRVAAVKRVETPAADACECLNNFGQCIFDNQACGVVPLRAICNWSSGRFFGHCLNCTDVVVRDGSQYQTPQEIIDSIEEFEPALVEFLKSKIALVEDLDFTYEVSTGTLTVEATVVDGVQDPTLPLNQVTYYLSQALDVFPGTITYRLSEKRSEVYTAELVVTDEESLVEMLEDSSASAVFVGGFAMALAARALF